ncbi:MAG TPA: HEAT repeat domain-containing protein [Mycobacteriales bacterium]|nr:HEAT repeat domain-containing protein [Mycobacteriales bacterium]
MARTGAAEQHAEDGGINVAVTGQVDGGVFTGVSRRPRELSEEVRRAYQERLVARYKRLDLEILTPKEQDEHRQVLLRSVFVPQHARAEHPPVELPKELWRRLVEAGELDGTDLPGVVDLERVAAARQAYQQQPARPVLEVLAEPGRRLVVVLGDPGAGKSTLARYVALELATDQPQGPLTALSGWLPLLVELRTYADPRWRERTFLDLIDHLHDTEGVGLPKEALQTYLHSGGQAVVIFDGLDEVFDPAVRETVSRQIVGFAARYPTARVLVTSRIIGYRRAVLAGAGFDHFTVQDLDRGQVEGFVSRWYELACPDDPSEAAQREQRLLAAVDGSPSLRELAGNPLLLTILAIIGRRQELPRDRRSVYAHAAAVLVEHWEVERHLRNARIDLGYIGPEDKHELLQHVARRMQDGPDGLAGNHISGADLLAEFSGYLQQRYQLLRERAIPAARAILAQFRERNFILSHFGAEVYGFVHRAFLEYFSAADIVSRFEQERSLDEQQLTREVFGRHWADPAWQEVLLLVAGMINERFTGRILDHLLRANPLWFLRPDQPPRHVLLAVRCIGEVRKLGLLTGQGHATIAAVTALLDLTTFAPFTWDHRLQESVVASLRQVALPVFEALGPAWPGREHYLDWYRLHGQDEEFSELGTDRPGLTAHILAALFPDTPKVKSLLQTQAILGANGAVREAAVQAVAAGWAQDPQTLGWLRQRGTDDPDGYVRQAAVEAVAAGWAQDPQTLGWLRQRGTDDEHWAVRQAAARAVAAGWAQDPQTLGWLRQRGTDDPAGAVRQAAVEAVAAGWAQDPQTLGWLRQRDTDDPDRDVRRAAARLVSEW